MRRPRRPLPFTVVATLMISLAGCSSDPPPPPASPTPFFATGPSGPSRPTGSTTGNVTGVTASTGATGALPSSPGAETGTISRGQVTLRVTGDVHATKTLRHLVSTVYTPPPGGIALVWTAGGTDASTVGIGGSSFVGTQPTGVTLQLTITVATADGFETFTSFDGECEVTIGEASARRIAGSFRCGALTSSDGGVVDIAATFSASG